MDNRMFNTWTAVTSLVMGIIGLIFVLVSIFDTGATNLVLAVGLLFVAIGNLLNIYRVRQNKKNQE